MATYQPPFLIVEDGTCIAIKYIESLRYTQDTEDQVIDRLSNDAKFDIRTVSGKEYRISAKLQMDEFGTQYSMTTDPEELREEISNKWFYYIRDSNGNSSA